jgi:hypothetical protein
MLDDFASATFSQLPHPNLLCYRTKRTVLIFQEAERRENVVDAQPRSQVMDNAHLAERFLQMSGGCEYESGDRSSRLPIAGLSRSAPTISLRRMNIAAGSAPTGLSSPTRGVSSKKVSRSPNTPILPTIP